MSNVKERVSGFVRDLQWAARCSAEISLQTTGAYRRSNQARYAAVASVLLVVGYFAGDLTGFGICLGILIGTPVGIFLGSSLVLASPSRMSQCIVMVSPSFKVVLDSPTIESLEVVSSERCNLTISYGSVSIVGLDDDSLPVEGLEGEMKSPFENPVTLKDVDLTNEDVQDLRYLTSRGVSGSIELYFSRAGLRSEHRHSIDQVLFDYEQWKISCESVDVEWSH